MSIQSVEQRSAVEDVQVGVRVKLRKEGEGEVQQGCQCTCTCEPDQRDAVMAQYHDSLRGPA